MEHEQIDAYLLGQLDEATARAVEQRAETDTDFAAEIQLHRDILLGIELSGEEDAKARIAATDRMLAAQGFFEPEPLVGPTSAAAFWKKYGWAVLAVLVLSVLAVIWWCGASQHGVPDGLPAEPSTAPPIASPSPLPSSTPPATAAQRSEASSPPKPVPPPPMKSRWLAMAQEAWSSPDYSGVRGGSAAQASLPARAAAFFQKKDYAAVVNLLETVPPTDPNYWMLSEMYAQACFLSGDTRRAAMRLRVVAASKQVPFAERAEWYLALCYLADFPQGRPEFDRLIRQVAADGEHPYAPEAKQLIERLR